MKNKIALSLISASLFSSPCFADFKAKPLTRAPNFLDIICIPQKPNKNDNNPIIRSRIQAEFEGQYVRSITVIHLLFDGKQVDRSAPNQYSDEGVRQLIEGKAAWGYVGFNQTDIKNKEKVKREIAGSIYFDSKWHYTENIWYGKKILFSMTCTCKEVSKEEDVFDENKPAS